MEDEENTFGFDQDLWGARVENPDVALDVMHTFPLRRWDGIVMLAANRAVDGRIVDERVAMTVFSSLKIYPGSKIRGIVLRIGATDSSFQRFLVHCAKAFLKRTATHLSGSTSRL
jgi:hypothetical protein